MAFKKGDLVLLPTYLAEGVIQPFKEKNISIVFYHLTPDLLPDFENINYLVKANRSARLLFVNHPFGFPIDLTSIKTLCRSFGVCVFEDCAQSLFGKNADNSLLGSKGDFSLFSLNKFLPVPDGAVLFSNRSDTNVAIDPSELQPSDDQTIQFYLEHLAANTELRNASDGKAAIDALTNSGTLYDKYYECMTSNLNLQEISSEASSVIALTNFETLTTQRRQNARYVTENLKCTHLKLLYPKFNDNAVFFALPALVEGCDRDKLIQHLISKGVLLSTLVDRWNFIPKGLERDFANEKDFIDRHVLIPINEFLSLDDMKVMVQALNSATLS